ncbi:hypothetical protein [Streptomyces sp. NBC_00872]|uniref:hypothetical protein n=1 Tax=Streptomyces sp. NBC_00872 TaxID=2903686 RepID=UPI0038673BCB|nr:hypothetical protein OG214_25395 [Streptomyces sp. NBC_00872]
MRLRHAPATGVTAAAGAAATVLAVAAMTIAPTAVACTPPRGTPTTTRAMTPTPAETSSLPTKLPTNRREPRCGKVSDPEFPIRTHIHGGPDDYRPGGDAGTWSLDLTNTTGQTCRDIHPVLVLVDRHRALDVSQLTLEITDGEGRWRTLPLEKTERDEIIGVLDDGSPGLVVAAGRTVSVRARLAFAAGTEPNKIIVTAATVQRRGSDGDWVGESNAYRLSLRAGGGDGDSGGRRGGAGGDRAGQGAGHGDGLGGGDGGGPGAGDHGRTVPRTPAPTAGHPDPGDRLPGSRQFARTGSDSDLLGRTAAFAALLTAGAVLALGIGRLRTDRGVSTDGTDRMDRTDRTDGTDRTNGNDQP